MSKTTDTLTISEKDFSRQVEDLLKTFHWRWCHFRPARTERGWRTALSGHQGFPDYIATKGNRLLFAELKSEKGKLSPEQELWIDSLRECVRHITLEPVQVGKMTMPPHGKLVPSFEVYVWRPSDFDEIVEILR